MPSLLAPLLACLLAGGDDIRLLDSDLVGPPGTMVSRHLLGRVEAATAEADRRRDANIDGEAIRQWQTTLRAHAREALGGPWAGGRVPAEVVRTIDRDGFSVELILLQSEPGVYVTGALFRPEAARHAPPWPAVLVPCGHAGASKAHESYQRVGMLAALNGFAAFVFDPIDQGERRQLVGRVASPPWGTTAHNRIGVSAALVGWDTARFEVRDGMRAIDYLVSRDDIDASRIGCMGQSGGGTQTSQLFAIDDRIDVAIVSCYLSRILDVVRVNGPQDAEQNLFGQLAWGFDHAEYLTSRAPAPAMIAAMSGDFFPIAGTWATFRSAKRVYARLGAPESVTIVENEGPHDWPRPAREASVRWLSRWLRGVDAPVVEPDLAAFPETELRVTDGGAVMLLDGARSTHDQTLEEARRLADARPALTRERVLTAIGMRDPASIDVPDSVSGREYQVDGHVATGWILLPEPGIALPGLLFEPSRRRSPPMIVIADDGRPLEIAIEGVEAEHAILAIDLRGFGETRASRGFYGLKDGDGMTAFLLGKTMVGFRAEDLIAAMKWMTDRFGEPVAVVAVGWAATPALHAAAVAPELFGGLEIIDPPSTWMGVVENAERHRFDDVVHGGLRWYDRGDLEEFVESHAVDVVIGSGN